MRPRIRLAVLLPACLLAACTSVTGTAAPESRPASPPSQGSPKATTSTAAAGTTANSASPLENVEPCGIVTRAEYEQALGRPLDGDPVRGDLGTARSCRYEVEGRLVVIDIRTNVGVADADSGGEKITDLTIGTHPARNWITAGSCFFALAVTAKSRVDVVVQPWWAVEQCAYARPLVELVERKLPPAPPGAAGDR